MNKLDIYLETKFNELMVKKNIEKNEAEYIYSNILIAINKGYSKTSYIKFIKEDLVVERA